MSALLVLLVLNRLRRTRLLMALGMAICIAGVSPLLMYAIAQYRAATLQAPFGPGHVQHSGHTPGFWLSVLVVAAAVAVRGLADHRSEMARKGRHAAPSAAAGNTTQASAASDLLLANPGAIASGFREEEFGRRQRRVELLSLARKQASTPPEFSKTIFAAALCWCTGHPTDAPVDALTPADLDHIAAALVVLECRQRSEPPERADYHYRALIGSGEPAAAWREPVLEALAENAAYRKCAFGGRFDAFRGTPGPPIVRRSQACCRLAEAIFARMRRARRGA